MRHVEKALNNLIKKHTMKKILKFSKRKIGTGLFEIGLQVEFYKNEIYNIESTTNDSRAFDGYDGGDRTLAIMCLRYNNLDEQEYDLNGLSVGKED